MCGPRGIPENATKSKDVLKEKDGNTYCNIHIHSGRRKPLVELKYSYAAAGGVGQDSKKCIYKRNETKYSKMK